ncbi:MAG: hypothetical protein P0Y53_01830 [Candidatus Pseudobacter hemicellulosilyticus]|uniref:Outer membrane protein beta-barrel domain-containing protein n=1 Tax=Candidatus Pseudobacter hemicellulosilyticus TaxID=3121375 RepID=A0AAJ5WSI3_9BACT|nr:MAG: hypothetical protein P0Y53_01830 [Pseudobacter sp.]
MKRSLLIACLLMIATVAVQAQEEEPREGGFDKSRLFFGGNFGFGIGGSTTQITVSPQVGYRFNQWLAAGAGVNFSYFSYKYNWSGSAAYKENYGVAGLNIFGRVYPIEFAFLQLQPELNYVWGKIKFEQDGQPDIKRDPKFVPSLLGGVGAAIPAGRGSFIVMVQYDLLQNTNTPYGSKAFFNFGYNIGL